MTPRKPKSQKKVIHPMQPVILVRDVARFKVNEICRWLIDSGRASMNEIACIPFSDEDRAQFAQLIGYSVSGWGDLSYVKKKQIEEADSAVTKLIRESK